MASDNPNKLKSVALSLPFEKFWAWLQAHPNCILRAGTPEALLVDDDDLHWHFAFEGADTLLVQLIRGKKLLGELAVAPSGVSYVQVQRNEGEEVVFELISETEQSRLAAYHFVLSHGYDEQETVTPGRWTH